MTYDPIDTNDDGVVDADVDNQSVSTEKLSSGSSEADVILTKDEGGTVYAVGMDGVISSGTDAVTVAQQGYDYLAQTMGGHFRFSPHEWTFSNAFEHWQSGISVTAPGAKFQSDGVYTGYLFKWYTIDGQTTTGDPDNIYNTYLDHIWIEAQGQCKGIFCETLLTSALGPNVYVHDTDGAGIRLSSTIRHCNFFSPKLRYCGNQSEASLHIEPLTDLSWENDGSNNVFFWGPSIVYAPYCHINVTSDLSKNSRPDRNINFYAGQIHGNFAGSYNRSTRDHLVKIHGAHNVTFNNSALRGAQPGDALAHIDTGPDGTVPDTPKFQGVTFDQPSGYGLQFAAPPTSSAHVEGCSFGEGQASDGISKIADWGTGDYDLVWDNNTWDSKNPVPFVGTAPNIISRSQDKRIIEGFIETWDDSRLNKRSVSQSLVNKADVGENNGPSERMLQPIPRYFARTGSPSTDPTTNHLRLPAGDTTEQSLQADVDFLATAGSWEFDVEMVSAPTSGYLSLEFWRGDTSNKFYLLIRADGSSELKKVDGGSVSVLISGSTSIDTSEHTYRVSRSKSRDWELFVDGASQGTAHDELLPPRPRHMRFDSTLDAAVDINEMVFY